MKKQWLKENGRHNILLGVVLTAIVIVFTFINPNFIKDYNLLSMAQTFVPYALLTLGVVFVIGSGNTDLSLGAVCIAAAVMAGKLYGMGMPLWGVIPVMVAIGILFGMLNGFLVAVKKIPSFIATLGTMMFARGFSALLVSDPNIFYPSGTWLNRMFSNLNGFPVGILWILAFGAIAFFLLYKNKTGRYILAIGSNSEAARLSGINTSKYVFRAYVISGIASGLAGIFWASSFATVAAATGNGMEFDAIAAAFIGGTSASGGSASVVGSVLGMVMLVVIRSGLNFVLSKLNLNLNSTYVTYAVTGIIIVTSILLDTRKKGVKRQSKGIDIAKKAAIVVAAAALLIGAASVYKSVVAERAAEKTISVMAKAENNAFWNNVRVGCEKAAREKSCKINFRGSESGDASELPEVLTIMQTMLGSGSDALVVAPLCEGYTDVLRKAYEMGIPVVEFDSGVFKADKDALSAEGKNPIIASVATDCYEASSLCAEESFKKVRDEIAATNGEYIVGIIQYEQSQMAEDRVAGFKDTFERLAASDKETAGKCKVYVEVKPDPTNDNYKLALESLAERNARLIFTPNLTSAEHVYNAILASNGRYDNIRFAGFDCGTKQIEWLRRKDGPVLVGAVVQNSEELGRKSVEAAINACNGEPVEEKISIHGIWYDKDNLDELIAQGVVYEG